MTNGERIEAKLDWLVEAVKHLLAVEAGVEMPSHDELEGWLDDADEDMSQFEHVAVRSAPKVPEPPACPHNQQALVDGYVVCVRPGCGKILNASGVRGRHATSPVPAPGHEDQFSHGTRV